MCNRKSTTKDTSDSNPIARLLVAADRLFELGGQHYLLVVDYFFRYPEVIKLTSTTSATVIMILKSIFSRHGIPEIVRSDNGPQFTSNEFTQFARTYRFRQVTSSPHYLQSNGVVKRKRLVRLPGLIAIIDATVKLFIGEGGRLTTRSHREVRNGP